MLGELYGSYTQLNRLEDKDKQWLAQAGIGLDREPEHDAAGINDDWPIGRGVFIHDKRQFVVKVNFEEHLEIIALNEDGIREGLTRLVKLLQTFEKLGYATDPYLGTLTVSPQNLGTALTLEVALAFTTKLDDTLDKEVCDEVEYGRHIAVVNRLSDPKHNDVQLVTQQTLAPNYNENI